MSSHVLHIHLLGICGTFMGGLALIAKELGFVVSGCDTNVYPPMSTLLEEQGINIIPGFDHINQPKADLYVIGNAVSRGNPFVEWILNKQLPYCSGPEFLSEKLLQDRWVLAVSGTHGKTTTTSMLAWILEYAGLKPGFLIGGVPKNFTVSARAGNTPFFVIEADEYDSAFFDKRSKFIHYHPRTLIINNIEFDHGDIFDDLRSIERQFHHLVRLVPSEGLLIAPEKDESVQRVLSMGAWTPCQFFSGSHDSQGYITSAHIERLTSVLTGEHNVKNAIASLLAAHHVGVPITVGLDAFDCYQGVKRRLELIGRIAGVQVFDDFAHHPTAIQVTLEALRERMKNEKKTGRLFAVVEPRSNTMKMGLHKQSLEISLLAADYIVWYQPEQSKWDIRSELSVEATNRFIVKQDIEGIIEALLEKLQSDDVVIIMSNGAFGGLHQRLLARLEKR